MRSKEFQQRGRGAAIKFLRAHVSHQGVMCLEWPMSRLPNGYGTLGFERKIHYAHRLMCQLAHGPAPSKDHEAAHSCGNRGCVNPHHLSWKTRAGNQYDRRLHGTMRSGRKLSKRQWDEIRGLKGKLTQREIAARYGVTFQNISAIHRSPGY